MVNPYPSEVRLFAVGDEVWLVQASALTAAAGLKFDVPYRITKIVNHTPGDTVTPLLSVDVIDPSTGNFYGSIVAEHFGYKRDSLNTVKYEESPDWGTF